MIISTMARDVSDQTISQIARSGTGAAARLDVAVVACVVIGLGIRLAAASGGPWLDEIWSWEIARSGDVLVAHDNNHLLNTLWLWLMRDITSTLAWRLPAAVCGAASVWVAAVILRRLGREHALVGALLVAVAHPLVVYQSEARGYSSMLLCLLIAIELQLRMLHATGSRRVLRMAMMLTATAGVLSHLSFSAVYVLIAMAAMLMHRFSRQAILDHAGGLVMTGIWWLSFGRRMSIGGGPELSVIDVLSHAAADVIGYGAAWGTAPIWIVAGAVAVSAVMLFQRNRALAILLIAIVIAYPLIVLLARDRLVYVRYFLPAIVCGLLLLSAAIGELISRRPTCLAGVVLLLVMAKCHAVRDIPLLAHGRDRHALAIAEIMRSSPERPTVGSDADFQLRTILDYYAHLNGSASVPKAAFVDDAPQWLVVMHHPSPQLLVSGGYAYELDTSYKAHALSGIPWQIYRRGLELGRKSDSAQTLAE
ncbi:MAG: hypothetical protein H7144_03600 [Burkholderiales bacterium]|nr:hypothetical protein [Phycisphaerae bacterium]